MHRLFNPTARWGVLVLAFASINCGGDSAGPEVPDPVTPGIDFLLSQDSVEVMIDGPPDTVFVGLLRMGGFQEAVDITVTGAPQGLTATDWQVTRARLQGLTVLTATSGAPLGVITLTVHANHPQITEITKPLIVNITPP